MSTDERCRHGKALDNPCDECDEDRECSLAQAPGSGTVRSNGYYIEVAPGGPWLTRGYGVTARFDERGVWQTLHDAQEAVEKALSPNE